MKFLQVKNRNSQLDYKAITSRDLPQTDSQRIITILRHQKAVQRALDFIQSRMKDPPTLGELASLSGMSRTYFSYIFREITGVKLQTYLAEARLDMAKGLLSDIDFKIKEVAYETGFRDPNYFCRTFKKRTGFNPTHWRLKKISVTQNLHFENQKLS